VRLSKLALVLVLVSVPCVGSGNPPQPHANETVSDVLKRSRFAAKSMRLGDALFRSDDIKGACKAYSQALAARSSWWMARLAVVRCGRFVGMPMETLVKHAAFAVSARPQIPATHMQYALVLEEAGKIERAIAAYEEALRSHTRLATARFRLGVLQARAGRIQAARINLEEVLSVRPDYMVARIHLTRVYEKLNLLKDAEQSLTDLVILSRYPARALARLIRFYDRHNMPIQSRAAKKRYKKQFER
jgi:tetratricopeptide (TPR) repeat protein